MVFQLKLFNQRKPELYIEYPLHFIREAILLTCDRNSWLTIISPAANGACSPPTNGTCSNSTDRNSTDRTSVTFGVDMRTGCTIRSVQKALHL